MCGTNDYKRVIMRLQQYINEEVSMDEIVEILNKDCKPFLSAMKKCKSRKHFWRGSKDSLSQIIKKNTRTDRKPRDIGEDLHKQLDTMFLKKFGWKVRSNSAFATSNYASTSEYGNLYLFFPISKFKFVWSPHIVDLWLHIDRLKHKKGIRNPQKEIINWYQDTNFCAALNSANEVAFNCKSYYLVRKYNKDFLYKEPTILDKLFK